MSVQVLGGGIGTRVAQTSGRLLAPSLMLMQDFITVLA